MSPSAAVCLYLLPSLVIGQIVGQSGPTRSDRQLTVAEVVKQTSGAVVQIVTFDADNKPLALGSGFIVSADGKIVTNHHIAGCPILTAPFAVVEQTKINAASTLLRSAPFRMTRCGGDAAVVVSHPNRKKRG